MKKLLLMLAIVMGFTMAGCEGLSPEDIQGILGALGKEDGENDSDDSDDIFFIDTDGNYLVNEDGGDVLVKVVTNVEYDVVIPKDVTWVTLSDTRALREEKLLFTVAPYEGEDIRSATIRLVGKGGDTLQKIVIVQSVSDELKLLVESNTISLGESIVFTVTKGNKDLSSEATIYDQNKNVVENPYTPLSAGTYTFYAVYETYSTNSISVSVMNHTSLVVPEDHDPANIAFHHRAVIFDHIGVNCGYCPMMIEKLITLKESEWGDLYNEVACHGGGYANGDPAFSNAAKIVDGFHNISAYPTARINFNTAEIGNYSYSHFVNYIAQTFDGYIKPQGADAGIAMAVIGDGVNVICSAQIKSAKYQEYKVNAWLLENDIYSPNQAGATKDFHKVYNHALRNTSETISKQDLAGVSIGYLDVGAVYNYDCEIAVTDSKWEFDNMEVLMIVTAKDNSGKWEIVNSVLCPIGKSVPYRYVGEPNSIGDAEFGDEDSNKLQTPVVEIVDITDMGFTAQWNAVDNATLYHVMLGNDTFTTSDTSYRFENLYRDNYKVRVRALGDGYTPSDYSKLTMVEILGPSSIDWFTQTVFNTEDNEENAEQGLYSSNSFGFTWKGEGIVDIGYTLYYTADMPSSYEDIISNLYYLGGSDAAIIDAVNSEDGFTTYFSGLLASTSYTLVAYVINDAGGKFLVTNEITIK